MSPHSWLHIGVTNEDGTAEEWAVEGGALRASARDIIFAEGGRLFIGTACSGAPDERPEYALGDAGTLIQVPSRTKWNTDESIARYGRRSALARTLTRSP